MTVKEDIKQKGKRKGRRGMIMLVIILVILAIGGGIGWMILSKEHLEAASLPLNSVNFDKLNDGTYYGAYAGGMYKWRVNECDVTVTNGKVTVIQLLGSKDPGTENTNIEMLYDRVIEAQSLQIDTISGATLTSKAYLQCIENALIQAQQE
ncbi:MAG: FMN-binding protein [Anaerolineaceae bacterium]